MNAHTPVLPTRAAAHALEHARLAALRGAISRQIKADLDRVDRCLAILDALDGDPDLEPSLGAPEPITHDAFRLTPVPGMPGLCFGSQETWAEGSTDDREDGFERDGETARGFRGGLAA
ncbi:hypothetical protein CIW48_26195 [Methylobacterium sp. P1-11]|uniref:hypothetical protein n=1 Tax=Methylobacterium sp. P1-11 TaxID=2024616 RepID=UPI0011F00469|nr:hypothetical protein [Methylobacterium sp. P1-11]KAA0121000.1 hypothetical protein CIW48_26195 [Methylobacterium sp. P1-11]